MNTTWHSQFLLGFFFFLEGGRGRALFVSWNISTLGYKYFLSDLIELLYVFKSYSVEFKFTLFDLPTYEITYENVGNQVEYILLVYILSVQLYDVQVEVAEKRWGSWRKCPFSPSSLIVGALLYIARNNSKWSCCNVWMLTYFPCCFFANPANVCHKNDIKKGAGDRMPWSCVLKLSRSFFGTHMIRITGMRNPDAGAGNAKICTTGCQVPQLVTAVWNPDKGAGLAKCRREQSCRRAFCAFS